MTYDTDLQQLQQKIALKKQLEAKLADLREQPPVEIAGVAVKEQKDYKDGSVVNVATGEKTTMELTDSNVLRYEMVDGTYQTDIIPVEEPFRFFEACSPRK